MNFWRILTCEHLLPCFPTVPRSDCVNHSRQIAAFFLGWAFFYSIQIILSSPLLRENSTRACSFFYSLVTKHIKRQHEPNDIEARTPTLPTTTLRHEENAAKSSTESNYSSPTFQLRVREGDALLVTLALCFACASVAHFASLLRYTPAGGTACGTQAPPDVIHSR